MIAKKMAVEKFSYIKNGQSLKVLAWILICLGIIYLILGFSGDLKTEDGSSATGIIIVIVMLFLGGGIFALYKAHEYIKKGQKYSRYVSIVNSGNDTLIDRIAAAYPTTYDEAVKDLQAMINDGYFLNAYINLNRRELVMPQITSANNVVNRKPSVPERRPITVKCKNCGAPNTIIPGTVKECDYCGSPL